MGKTKLLLVDDMEWVYEVVRLKLGKKYLIDYVKTEKQALKKIKENNYGLVVSDYYLGKKSPKGGLKIIKAAIEKGLPATLMSREDHWDEAEKEGANFIFKKNLSEL